MPRVEMSIGQYVRLGAKVFPFDDTPTPTKKVKVVKPSKPNFFKDRYGNVRPYPSAILKEKYIKNASGNEEESTDFVTLEIVEQQYDFYLNKRFDENGVVTNSDYNVHYQILLSSDGSLAQCVNSAYAELFLRGRCDKDQSGGEFKLPLDKYEYIKKCLLQMYVEIIPDEEGKKTLEELNKKEKENMKKVSYVFNEKPTNKEIEKMISLVDVDKFHKLVIARLIGQGSSADLSKLDKNTIKNYLKTWAVSKYKFYKMFGDKLTLNKDIEVEKERPEFEVALNELREKFPLYAKMLAGVSPSALMNNNIGSKIDGRISETFFKDIKVKDGMSFTKFISLYGNKELDIEVSKIYQDKGIAHLVISIDPMDYLTVSLNASGWHSCHHFFNGCNRNATLSYMNDETSLVAYRTNGDVNYNFQGKKIEWNTKCWRQMVYISPESSTTVFSRQYPYDSEVLTYNIRQMIEECMCKFFNSENKWTIYRKRDNAKTDVRKSEDSLVYNDIGNGRNCEIVKAKDDENKDKATTIYIGAKVRGVYSSRKVDYTDGSIW